MDASCLLEIDFIRFCNRFWLQINAWVDVTIDGETNGWMDQWIENVSPIHKWIDAAENDDFPKEFAFFNITNVLQTNGPMDGPTDGHAFS